MLIRQLFKTTHTIFGKENNPHQQFVSYGSFDPHNTQIDLHTTHHSMFKGWLRTVMHAINVPTSPISSPTSYVTYEYTLVRSRLNALFLAATRRSR